MWAQSATDGTMRALTALMTLLSVICTARGAAVTSFENVFQTVTLSREQPVMSSREWLVTLPKEQPVTSTREWLVTSSKEQPLTSTREWPDTSSREWPEASSREQPMTSSREQPVTSFKEQPVTSSREWLETSVGEEAMTSAGLNVGNNRKEMFGKLDINRGGIDKEDITKAEIQRNMEYWNIVGREDIKKANHEKWNEDFEREALGKDDSKTGEQDKWNLGKEDFERTNGGKEDAKKGGHEKWTSGKWYLERGRNRDRDLKSRDFEKEIREYWNIKKGHPGMGDINKAKTIDKGESWKDGERQTTERVERGRWTRAPSMMHDIIEMFGDLVRDAIGSQLSGETPPPYSAAAASARLRAVLPK